MDRRWSVRIMILGALCAAPSILLRAQTSDQTNQSGSIGSHNIGCALGRFNAFTPERQIAVGRSLAQQIELHAKFVSDPVVTEYVNRIGQNILLNADAQTPFTIKVVDAIALPGGFVYVSSGLLLAVNEEAEVAGIMAHEIAHVAACHAGRQWTSAERAVVPSVPVILPPGGVDDMVGMGGILTFGRGFEAEADYLGIQYMCRAGYDPYALVSFFDKIHAMENAPWRLGLVAKSFETHTQNADRIEKSKKEIRSILPIRQQYMVTNSEFDRVQARLAAIENKDRMLNF